LTRKKLALSYTQYTKHTSGRLSVCFENPWPRKLVSKTPWMWFLKSSSCRFGV
jgi:hypothetical protein